MPSSLRNVISMVNNFPLGLLGSFWMLAHACHGMSIGNGSSCSANHRSLVTIGGLHACIAFPLGTISGPSSAKRTFYRTW
ncbi:hypothetical protein BDV41DRAFT_442671 [Aspergillus transmontanensis]|uniref:Secreted protein n=1 Tax=Aspergillus transmontanensis TaxID=1034304 RepID=A0A5N6WB68_9EURO|nr:hypothetical protein BDV41DRAFT_442671 [Aspergillus transmontanensis]